MMKTVSDKSGRTAGASRELDQTGVLTAVHNQQRPLHNMMDLHCSETKRMSLTLREAACCYMAEQDILLQVMDDRRNLQHRWK